MNPEDFQNTRAGEVVRTSAGYWAFVPHPLPPDIQWSPALITAVGEAERSLGRLDSLASTLPSPQILVRPFARREAVLSSRIEGTQASLSDVYAFEAARLSYLAPSSDAGEVHNYIVALEGALERLGNGSISLETIREVHTTLMGDGGNAGVTPGDFRYRQNWIGYQGSSLETATFVPPAVGEMLSGLTALEKFMASPSEIPPLVRAALIHYQFEVLHPFLDGNGRVGRLLVILLMIQWGLLSQPWLYLSAFFESNRFEYYERLLRVSQRGEWEEWLAFFLLGVKSQSEDALLRIRGLLRLQAAYREQLRDQRAMERLLQALEIFFERPILTIRQLQSALDVPYRTAQRYVQKLEALGIVREITGRARNRIYQADEVITALEETRPPQ